MRDSVKIKQKVQNAIKYFYILLFLFTIIIGCVCKKNIIINEGEYKIEKYRTFDGLGAFINVKVYDKKGYNDSISRPIININNLFFNKKKVFNVGFGKHNIAIDLFGKLGLKINSLKVQKGDSIVIKAYLKDDDRPLYD